MKMKKIFLSILTIILLFGLVTFSQEENKVESKMPRIKYTPGKLEIKIPPLSETKIGKEFKAIDDFVRQEIAAYIGAEFFMLFPQRKAVGQGKIENFDTLKLTINSNGFKTIWIISTDTVILGAKNLRLLAQAFPTPVTTTSLQVGQRVKVLGIWDGEHLVAKRIISLEPRRVEPLKATQKEVQKEKLIERLQEALQKTGVQIDLKSIIEGIYKKEEPRFCLQVITPARNPLTGECKEFPTPCDVPQGWQRVYKCE